MTDLPPELLKALSGGVALQPPPQQQGPPPLPMQFTFYPNAGIGVGGREDLPPGVQIDSEKIVVMFFEVPRSDGMGLEKLVFWFDGPGFEAVQQMCQAVIDREEPPQLKAVEPGDQLKPGDNGGAA